MKKLSVFYSKFRNTYSIVNTKRSVVFLEKVGARITTEHKKKEYNSYDIAFLILEKEDDYNGSEQ